MYCRALKCPCVREKWTELLGKDEERVTRERWRERRVDRERWRERANHERYKESALGEMEGECFQPKK